MLPESRQGGTTPHSKAGLNVDPRFDTFCTVKLHWSEFGGNMSGVSTQSPPSTNCNLIDFSLPECLFCFLLCPPTATVTSRCSQEVQVEEFVPPLSYSKNKTVL